MKKTQISRLMNLPHTWERAYKMAILFADEAVNTLTIDELKSFNEQYVHSPQSAVNLVQNILWLNDMMESVFVKVVGRPPMPHNPKFPANDQFVIPDKKLYDDAMEIAFRLGLSVEAIKAERDTPKEARLITVREGDFVYRAHHRSGQVIVGQHYGATCIRFNFQEWRSYHKTSVMPDEIDSNDLGWWFNKNGKMSYHKPNAQWRKPMANMEGAI